MGMPGAVELYIDQFKLRDVLNPDLLRHLRRVEFARQHTIPVHTPERDSFYLLVAGRVQISHTHLNGKRSVLAELTPLAAIGDLELFNSPDFAAVASDVVTHVVTVEDSVLLSLEQSIVRRYGRDDPRFLRFIIHTLSQKLYHTSAAQVGNVLPLANRFASFLLQQQSSGERVEIPPKEDLAGYLGTTARHLNRVIRQFQERGWIAVEGRTVRILQRGEVEQMAVG